MFTTNYNQAFSFNVSDSTVFVNAGVTQVGPYVMSFRGGSKSFAEMTDFSSASNVYQYSVLCLQNSSNFPDMTTVTFTPVGAIANLTSPRIGDSTNLKALGLFLFHTDGTNLTLTSANRIQ